MDNGLVVLEDDGQVDECTNLLLLFVESKSVLESLVFSAVGLLPKVLELVLDSFARLSDVELQSPNFVLAERNELRLHQFGHQLFVEFPVRLIDRLPSLLEGQGIEVGF